MNATAIQISEIKDLAVVQPYWQNKAIKKELGLALTDRGYRWFVAQDGDKVLGFAAIAPIKSGTFPLKGAGAEIKYFYVLPEHRNSGVGNNMMQTILKAFENLPIKAVITAGSKKFYESFGFAQVDSCRQYPLMARGV